MIQASSIVIEWENARFADLERTRQMLRSLLAQIVRLNDTVPRPEVIFLYDRNSIDGEMVRQTIDEDFPAASHGVAVQVVASEGLRYYQQKNHGAQLAQGDIVIFLDCDVVPEVGWLEGLLGAFADPAVQVVAGETYIEYHNFYSKAFALFWFFHLRDPSQDLRFAAFFHANNVAFRRETIARFPFPEIPAYRGQCSVLGRTLRANNIPIHVLMGARVSHPCPLGVRYFVGRALNNGRDQVIVARIDSGGENPPWRSVYWNFSNSLQRTVAKIGRHGDELGLGPLARIGALGVALTYFGLKAIGELVTLKSTNAIQRLFPI